MKDTAHRYCLTIKTRIEDAEHLWAEGRKEGAWVQALIAAAATARRRYPRPTADNRAFKQFICDIAGTIVHAGARVPGPLYLRFYTDDRAEHRTLEDIFYSELRCNLVHEAELKEVGFSDSRVDGCKLVAPLSVPARGAATIPDFWVLHLIAAVKAAPENNNYWPLPPGDEKERDPEEEVEICVKERIGSEIERLHWAWQRLLVRGPRKDMPARDAAASVSPAEAEEEMRTMRLADQQPGNSGYCRRPPRDEEERAIEDEANRRVKERIGSEVGYLHLAWQRLLVRGPRKDMPARDAAGSISPAEVEEEMRTMRLADPKPVYGGGQ